MKYITNKNSLLLLLFLAGTLLVGDVLLTLIILWLHYQGFFIDYLPHISLVSNILTFLLITLAVGRLFKHFRNNAKQLHALDKKQQEAAWQTEGIAQVMDILHEHDENLPDLGNKLTKFLCEYAGMMAVGFFVTTESKEDLELITSLGFNSSFPQRINVKQGLYGHILQKEQAMVLHNIQEAKEEKYLVQSAFLSVQPQNAVILPLYFNHKLAGIIEGVFTEKIADYQLAFLEKIAESIAATIIEIKQDQENSRLLAESQMLTENLRAQEEELRQNFEEIRTVQEQLKEKMEQTELIKNELAARDKVLNISALVTESDIYGNITYANEKFCEVSQYGIEECIGKPHNIIRHPDTPKELFREMWQTIKSGKVFHATFKNKRKDGSTYWVETNIAPVLDANGRVVRYIGVRFDITERMEYLQRVEYLLAESEEKTEQLQIQGEALQKQMKENEKIKNELTARINVLNQSAIVTEADLHGTIIYANRRFCETSKYSLEECIGKPHNIVRHPDTPKEVFQEMWKTIKNGGTFKGILKNRAKDGNPYWVDTTIAPILDEKGLPVKYISVRFDITEQVRQAKQIEQLLLESLEINKTLKTKEAELTQINAELLTAQAQLKEANESLEEKVLLRTQEISLQKAEIEHKKNEIESSIRYAKRIQEAMLPTAEELDELMLDYFVFYQPRDIVSGDFYWVAESGEYSADYLQTNADMENKKRYCFFAVADCTGHGVPGAFMSMIGISKLNQIVKEQEIINTGDILRLLNEEVHTAMSKYGNNSQTLRDGMDIGLCCLDREKQKLYFSGAIHSLVYIQEGQLHFVKGDKRPIGGGFAEYKSQIFSVHQINLDKPTTIYLYSDGFQDQFGGSEGRKFMSKQFRELLFQIHHLPTQEQHSTLAKVLKNWLNERYKQIDDILVVGVRIKN
jgi:PAS domain S-box-containing protein